MEKRTLNRASKRIDVHLDAVLVNSVGTEVDVVVLDLSADGFRIETNAVLRVGEEVILRTKRDGNVPARIVWTLGLEAGGTFNAKPVVA